MMRKYLYLFIFFILAFSFSINMDIESLQKMTKTQQSFRDNYTGEVLTLINNQLLYDYIDPKKYIVGPGDILAFNMVLPNNIINMELIVSPTGSGKSLMIYSIVRFLFESGQKTLIVVPTTSLVEQMYKDFIDIKFFINK